MNNIVLFTQRVDLVESYDERRDCADQRITKLLSTCGFLPVPVPNNPNVAKKLVQILNPVGIILTGGNSLVKYGGNAEERDATDKVLIDISVLNRIPLYGLCRGMQSILDYFGNTIVQIDGHVAVRHVIHGKEGEMCVNSYHTQGCIEVSHNEIEVLMKSEDGVIEKIRHKKLPILGTMWHPERENPFRELDIEMIRGFLEGER